MGEMIIEALFNLISTTIGVDFITRYFGVKMPGKKQKTGFAVTCLLYFTVLMVFNARMENEGLHAAVYSLILFLYALLFLQGKTIEKLVISVLWNIILIAAAMGSFSIVRLVFGREFMDSIVLFDGIRLGVLLIATIAKIILTRIVLLLRKRDELYLDKRESVMSVILFIVLYFMVLAFFSVELGDRQSGYHKYLVFALLSGFIGIVLFIYYFFQTISRNNKKQLESALLHENETRQEQQLQQINKQIEEMSILRHDMKNNLETLRLYLQEADIDGAGKLLNSLLKEVKSHPALSRLTENRGVNAAIAKAVEDCRENQISFDYRVLLNKIPFPETDIGVLLMNLLNNAVEACCKNETNRSIQLVLQKEKDYLHITLMNTIQDSVLEHNPELQTTKSDKKLHGYGLKSIQQIVEHYDGGFLKKEAEGMFQADVFLKFTDSLEKQE